MIRAGEPALVLAPMEGITDAPMRALMGELGAFSFGVTEFIRVSQEPLPSKVFRREVPELALGSRTATGMPVVVQILGGHPERMAISAQRAVAVGARAIDINFGCPAPTVNRNDGGATLLQYPDRIREIVRAVRDAVPAEVPVSAKLRLGWDSIEPIHVNAERAVEGGASWLTIHARTRTQGYAPPVYWHPIGQVRRNLVVPIVANGDIWSFEDYRRCQDVTGCEHFMIGRSALADPNLPGQIARDQGRPAPVWGGDLAALLHGFLRWSETYGVAVNDRSVKRLKQWLSFGDRSRFDRVKRSETLNDFFQAL